MEAIVEPARHGGIQYIELPGSGFVCSVSRRAEAGFRLTDEQLKRMIESFE
jgi:hypothetical protein